MKNMIKVPVESGTIPHEILVNLMLVKSCLNQRVKVLALKPLVHAVQFWNLRESRMY